VVLHDDVLYKSTYFTLLYFTVSSFWDFWYVHVFDFWSKVLPLL